MNVVRLALLVVLSGQVACNGTVGHRSEMDGGDGWIDGMVADGDSGVADLDDGDSGAGDSEDGDGGEPDGGGDQAVDGSQWQFQGYGSVTQGALSSPQGYDTYHVTKLDDDGSQGTLRDALSQSQRMIVFDVGGTITLDSALKLENDYLTIDGLSAPDPGITITHRVGEYHGLIIDGQRRHTHDLVIQGLRFRGVYDVDPVHVVGRAIFSADGDCRSEDCDGGISRLVLDRITLAYASDKFTLWGKVSEVTFSNSFFYGSNKAFLISFYGESYDLLKEKISIHHNLFAQNEERSPQLVAWITDLDYRNNIVYDWLQYGMRIKSVNVGGRGIHSVDASIVNNLFSAGSGPGAAALVFQADEVADCPDQGQVLPASGMGDLWVAGNSIPDQNCDQYSTVAQPLSIPEYAQVTTHAPEQLCLQTSPFVGAPFRTAHETALVEEVRGALGCL